MIVTIFIVSLLAISAVNAADNATCDIVSANDANEIIDVYGDVLSVDDLENDNLVNNHDVLGSSESQDEISLDNDVDIKIISHADSNVGDAAKLTVSKNQYYANYDDNDFDFEHDYYYDEAILKPTKLTTTYNSGKTFNVKAVSVFDKNYVLSDLKLKLRVYTKSGYKDYYAYTNYKGIAKFKVSKIALGTHKVSIYSADSDTRANKITSKVIIKKANTKVYAPRITTKYKKSKTFKITIKDKSSKKAVKNVKISVQVGKKKYTLKTNSKGVASFKTKYMYSGTYNVFIKSKNSRYNINGKSKIIIKNVPKKKAKKKSSSSSSGGGGYYVGSANSDKFHYPSCSAAKRIKSYNKISFSSRSQAINAGYSPCRICYP